MLLKKLLASEKKTVWGSAVFLCPPLADSHDEPLTTQDPLCNFDFISASEFLVSSLVGERPPSLMPSKIIEVQKVSVSTVDCVTVDGYNFVGRVSFVSAKGTYCFKGIPQNVSNTPSHLVVFTLERVRSLVPSGQVGKKVVMITQDDVVMRMSADGKTFAPDLDMPLFLKKNQYVTPVSAGFKIEVLCLSSDGMSHVIKIVTIPKAHFNVQLETAKGDKLPLPTRSKEWAKFSRLRLHGFCFATKTLILRQEFKVSPRQNSKKETTLLPARHRGSSKAKPKKGAKSHFQRTQPSQRGSKTIVD